MRYNIVALVPMRHDSERVPGKNYRTLNGQPLYYWILNTLSTCDLIKSVYVDTDSRLIKERAPEIHPKIQIIDRPKDLCSGSISMNEILRYDVKQVEADYYLQTHCTNPLLQKKTIEKAIHQFINSHNHDSLFGVTKLQTRIYDQNAKVINHDPEKLERTQDLPPIYEENSNLYLFSKNVLQRKKNRIGDSPILFEIPRHEAWDIDEELDFKIAEFLQRDY